MVMENRQCLCAWPRPNYRCCTEIVGLPWIAEPSHSAISSSIILTLFLPLELCWDCNRIMDCIWIIRIVGMLWLLSVV